MKVLALGGCGGMGRYAVETAINFDSIEKITVADLSLENAARFADRFDERVEAAQVDVKDNVGLRELMDSHDVVLSTVGPYYIFGTLVLQAAIDTKTHYIDICDDWEPTLEMFEVHRQAEEAGITAVVGAGASPGISNLLARVAIEELERVDEVYTTWGSSGGINDNDDELDISDEHGKPTAATIHWLQQLTGSIRDHQNGRCVESTPLQKIVIDYPGIGESACYSCGHPEPLTLPLYYPGIRHSKNIMNMPGYIIYVLKEAAEMVNRGEKTIEEAAQLVVDKLDKGDASLKDTAAYLYHQARDKTRSFLPALTAVAIGRRNNNPMTVSAHLEGEVLDGKMGATTCVPSAIILKMLSEGEITTRGVVAPEGCVEPKRFFELLSQFVSFNGGFDADNYLVVRHK